MKKSIFSLKGHFYQFFSVFVFLILFVIITSCGRQGLAIQKGTPGLHDFKGEAILGSNPKSEVISILCAKDIKNILNETSMDNATKAEFKALVCGPEANQMAFYEFYCNLPKEIKHQVIIEFMFSGYSFGNCG